MILVNGKQQDHVDVIDRGFQYGDGLFETCAVKEGKILAWSQHKQRLQQGCEQLCNCSFGLMKDEQLQQDALARRPLVEIIGEGDCLGTPKLKVGTLIQFQGFGQQFSGTYDVIKTTHRYCAEGYYTQFLVKRMAKSL